MEQLVDGHGRPIADVRISVTDRCNLRCSYCMPREGIPWFARSELLTYEEIARIAEVLAGMGVSDIRLTGGEPLVRRDLPDLVRMLDAIPGVRDLSITTNGLLLEGLAGDLARAGLGRLNVSLDSLVGERFAEIARRDALDRVLAGLKEAERHPRLWPIKVNVVALKGFTEREVLDFAEFARRTPYIVRFIEFMPLDGDRGWNRDRVLPNAEVRRIVESRYELEPLAPEAHATATRFRFADGRGEIGFVSSVTEPFCGECNRIRFTADGRLRTCLFSVRETDLRGPLRDGAGDGDLAEIIRSAIWRKELKHRIGEPGFAPPERPMSRIGG